MLGEKIEIKIARNKDEIQKIFDIRKKVFCGEQNVPEEIEYDEYDKAGNVEHVILLENGNAIGCARLRPVGDDIKLERIAILNEYRSKGYGRAIVKWLVYYCKKRSPKDIYMNAQYYLKNFYSDLGFEPTGEPFEEAGIKHIKMIYKNEKSPF